MTDWITHFVSLLRSNSCLTWSPDVGVGQWALLWAPVPSITSHDRLVPEWCVYIFCDHGTLTSCYFNHKSVIPELSEDRKWSCCIYRRERRDLSSCLRNKVLIKQTEHQELWRTSSKFHLLRLTGRSVCCQCQQHSRCEDEGRLWPDGHMSHDSSSPAEMIPVTAACSNQTSVDDDDEII